MTLSWHLALPYMKPIAEVISQAAQLAEVHITSDARLHVAPWGVSLPFFLYLVIAQSGHCSTLVPCRHHQVHEEGQAQSPGANVWTCGTLWYTVVAPIAPALAAKVWPDSRTVEFTLVFESV